MTRAPPPARARCKRALSSPLPGAHPRSQANNASSPLAGHEAGLKARDLRQFCRPSCLSHDRRDEVRKRLLHLIAFLRLPGKGRHGEGKRVRKTRDFRSVVGFAARKPARSAERRQESLGGQSTQARLPARVTVGREHALKARARCEPATGIAARNELAAAARVAGQTPA